MTAVSTFVLSFTSTGTAAEALQRGLVLAAGLGVLAYLALSDRVDRYLSWLIEAVLNRVGGFQVRDTHTILNLGGGYMVTRMEVDPESWLAGETLQTIKSSRRGPHRPGHRAPGRHDGLRAGGRRLRARRRLRHRVWPGGTNCSALRPAPVQLRPDGGDGFDVRRWKIEG
ncbi:MAG: hypothetical protein BRD30_06510 [Bacteroidetes bacterium QH_2_63_10]|nr:MAG: hypothetical protein BRD30_06510 [Bacteroidetes bacterium QH_2_63_10]